MIRNKFLGRITAGMLIAAMLITDSSVAAYADELTVDDIVVVEDMVDGNISDVTVDVDDATDTVVSDDPAESDDIVTTDDGDIIEDITEVPDAMTVSDNEVEPEEGEDIFLGSFSMKEAHGAPGKIFRNRFKAFSNNNRTDYYWKYQNQLGPYGKEIYEYLEEHAEEFISPEDKEFILILNNGQPVADINSEFEAAQAQLWDAYAAFDWDHPEIFWLEADNFSFEFWGSTYLKLKFAHQDNVDSYTIYDHDTEETDIEADRMEINQNIQEITSEAEKKRSIKSKIECINDWLANENYYNRYVYKHSDEEADKKAWTSASALTAQTWLASSGDMGDKSAPVCEGYARAFKMVCDKIGIPCIVVSGDGHMWNYVQNEDGIWYAVDVTWDDPVRNDEWTNRITPSSWIHNYIMVGGETVVPGREKGFTEDGHHPNASFWTDGTVMPTPTISTTAYEEDMGADISDFTVVPENSRLKASFKTDKTGKYYYVLRQTHGPWPSVYEIQNMVTDVETGIDGGAGSGTVTASDVANGQVTFYINNPPDNIDHVHVFLVQLTDEEYISDRLICFNVPRYIYVGWKSENGRQYYYCPENYEGWEDNINSQGNHVNELGAMATGAVWIDDQDGEGRIYKTLYKFAEDGHLIKVWHRIKNISINDIPEADTQVADNVLQRGMAYRLGLKYVEEERPGETENEPVAYEDMPADISDNRTVTWISDKPRVISVDSDGTLHALQVTDDEVITITAKTGDEDNRYHPTATIRVKVSYPIGWFSVEGKKYYGEKNASGSVVRAEGFREISDKRYYFYPAGDTGHTPYSMAVGDVEIEGIKYTFGTDGALVSSSSTKTGFETDDDGKIYYYESGVKVTGTVKKIGNCYYGFDSDGARYSNTFFKLDGDYYYADERGVLATGTRYVNQNGICFFADESYSAENSVPVCSMITGLVTSGSDTHYFKGITVNSLEAKGKAELDGGYMLYGYFEGDGVYTGKHFYALPETNAAAGILATGWIKVGDEWKLFRAADDPVSPYSEEEGAYAGGWVSVNEGTAYKRYYINSAGKTLKGWQTISGKKYYFNEDGSVTIGLQNFSGSVYYFGENNSFGTPNDDYGIMKTGRYTVGSDTFFFGTNGIRQTGWQKDPVTQIWDYYDLNTGKAVGTIADSCPNPGLNAENWYEMRVGGISYYYYFKNNSTRMTGMQTIEGDKYYFDSQAGIVNGRMVTGLYKIGTSYYYFREDNENRGKLLTGLSKAPDAGGTMRTYYANTGGVLQVGWQKIDGTWRYFDRNTGYETSAAIDADYWATVTGPNGVIYSYYFKNGTAMATGKQLVEGKYYYFSEDKNDGSLGRLVKNSYVRIGKNIYRADAEGVIELLTAGWHNIDGKYKYIDKNNNLLTGWQTIDGEKYYFDNDGIMATGDFVIGKNSYRTHEEETGYTGSRAGVCYVNDWYSYYDDDDADGMARRRQYFNASGARQTGWLKLTVSGRTQYYYLSPEVSADGRYNIGDMYTGVNTIGNSRYVFDKDGINLRSGAGFIEADNVARIDDNVEGTYCANGNGVLLFGWQKIDNVWRYFDHETGKERTATKEESFITVGTDRYYFVNGTTMATGFKDINGSRYFFYNDAKDTAKYGKMAKGWFFVGKDKYYANDEGHLVTGLVSIEGNRYFFSEKNILLTGWQITNENGADGYRQYFDETKNKNDALYGAGLDCDYLGNGFYSANIDGSIYYYRFVNNTMQKGWQTINGKRFCFGADGRLQTGLFKYGNDWYYTSEEGDVGVPGGLGCVVSGIKTLDKDGVSRTYYFNSNGLMQKGWQTINGKAYYFDTTAGDNLGAMMFGRFKVSEQYYFTDQETGVKKTGCFIPYCGGVYYANGSGQLLKGWQTIKGEDNVGRKYYFDAEGRMAVGWQTIGKDRYYFKPDGDSPLKGAMQTGFVDIDGATYCLSASGVMQTGWQKVDGVWGYFAGPVDMSRGNITQEKDLGKCFYRDLNADADPWKTVTFSAGKVYRYYISNNKTIAKGWVNVKDSAGVSRKYYFDPVTGELWTGLNKIGKDLYVLPDKDENLAIGRRQVDGSYYFFDTNGKALTGWRTSTGNKTYYYNLSDYREDHGEQIDIVNGKSIFAIKISGKSYRLHATEAGDACEGSRYGAALEDGYLTDKNGQLLSGWQTVDGKKYYFDPADCHMIKNEPKIIGSNWYWFAADGVMQTGFVDDNGTVYYFNSSGIRQSGWQTISGRRYYFDPEDKEAPGCSMVTGWKTIGKDRYCFSTDPSTVPVGSMLTGIKEIGSETYFFNDKGILQTGWQKVDNNWRYFATQNDIDLERTESNKLGKFYSSTVDGVFWKTVSFDDGTTCRYYFNNDKTLLKGWQTIGGKRYYFNSFGELQTDDFAINNVRYHSDDDGAAVNGIIGQYYYKNGVMQTGWQTIEGKKYYFNANGVIYKGIRSVSDKYYYFDEDDGHLLIGEFEADSKFYYSDKNGILQKGWVKYKGIGDGSESWKYHETDGANKFIRAGSSRLYPEQNWYIIDENIYYIKDDRTLTKGFADIKDPTDNKTYKYFFDTEGKLAVGEHGLITAGSDSYHASSPVDGKEESKGRIDKTEGFSLTEGKWYYFDASGKVFKGFKTIRQNNVSRKYYLSKEDGSRMTGSFSVDGVYYYAEEDGVIYTGFRSEGSDLYYYNSDGKRQSGWQTIKGGRFTSDNVSRKYYFDPQTGVAKSGFAAIDGKRYYFTESGDDSGALKTGYFAVGSANYYANKNGAILTGWNKINNVWRYFALANGTEIVPEVSVNVADKAYWTALDEEGEFKVYYINNNSTFLKGWQKINNKRYYFLSDGRLAWDGANTEPVSLENGTDVKFITIGTDRFIIASLDREDFIAGDRDGAMALTGFYKNTAGQTYYANADGKILKGWQNIKDANGKTGRYWFGNEGVMAQGPRYVDNVLYLFDEQGLLKTGKTNIFKVGGFYYCPNDKGVICKGWIKCGGPLAWHYFDPVNGQLSYKSPDGAAYMNEETGSLDSVGDEVPAYSFEPAGSAWAHLGSVDVYYLTENGPLKGWQKIDDKKYYFNPSTGLLVKGDSKHDFRVGNDFYHTNTDWSLYMNDWLDRDDKTGTPREYYNDKGIRVTGWQNLTRTGVTSRYWFDGDGRMATGLTSIDGTLYFFDDEGVLVKDREVSTGENTNRKRYRTDSAGKIITGWKTINGKKYYFDPRSGVMQTGRVIIDGKTYYFNDDGTLITGKGMLGDDPYYTDNSGNLRLGWITSGSKNYYADPETGKLVTGFATIAGQNYYFNEETSKAGEMCTGFFMVPDMGQSYYDRTDGASNMYYAGVDGVLHEGSGWDIISTDPSYTYAQKWSYYFNPKIVGYTPQGSPITGEVVTGNVVINDEGAVTYLGATVTAADNFAATGADGEDYYRFDPVTGARRKAMLVFYGNYYGEVDYDYDEEAHVSSNIRPRISREQQDVMHSISRYANTDGKLATDSGDFYYVNSSVVSEQQRLYTAGLTGYDPVTTTFPVPASSYYPEDENDEHPECHAYKAGNDIAEGLDQAGSDGNVDVYDVEMYSWDVYRRAMAKFGQNNLVLVGISSGGGICLGLCQKAYANGLPQPENTVLYSPWVDLETNTNVDSAQSGFTNMDTFKYWAARYTRDNDISDDYYNEGHEGPGIEYPFASPIKGDLTCLKNVTIYTGSYDPCYTDSKALADAAAGVVISVRANLRHAYMFINSSTAPALETIHNSAWQFMTQAVAQ